MLGAFAGYSQNPITTHPTDERGCTRGGFVATFSINSVSGAVYQWEADTGSGWASVPAVSPFGGTNGPVLTISNPDGCKGNYTQDSTRFRCRIFLGGTGGTHVSNAARLILYAPIDSSDFTTKYGTFTANVPNDTVCEDGSTSYTVSNLATTDTCVGIKDQSYQWQYKPFGGSWTNVPGTNPSAETATLNLTNIPLGDDLTEYRCMMQTSGCTQIFYSDTVTLVVDPKPYAGFDTTNIYVCEGDSFTIPISVWNSALSANRGSLPTGWELYFDTSLMGGYAYLFDNAPLDSITGVGNGSPSLLIGHSGISTTGIYTLKLDSIVNDSASLRCARALGDVITINVYPRPNATIISSSPRTVCEEDSVCFTVEVTNAAFNGTGVDWILYVTNPYGTIAPSGIYQGNGNSTLTFCTSTGLLTDSFRITLDSIKIVGTAASLVGDSCSGTISPQDSIDILVLPKPFAALGQYSYVYNVSSNYDPVTNVGLGNLVYNVLNGASDNDSAGSHYFDFAPAFDMRLDSIAIQIHKPTAPAEDIKIWYRPTGYDGFQHSSAGWTLANTVSISGPLTPPGLTSVQLPTGGIDMTGGVTYGIYIEAETDGAIGTKTMINHWPGAVVGPFAAPYTTIESGEMGVRDFLVADTFAPISPTQLGAGLRVTYRGGDVVSGDTVRVCQGDSFDFDFVVGNTMYEGIPLNWELTFTDPTGTMNHTTPLTGTGDSAFFDRIYTAALTPGRYTFSLNSIKLTPTAGAPIPPDCIHIIDDEFFTIEVVPKINAQFNKDTFNLCKGSGDVFDIEITNALFDGQPVQWELFYTDPSGILPGGANTGAGNSTPSYTVPNTLSTGTYYIYLDSIKTVGTDPICLGTTGPLDTIVINVLPYPRAALQATWLHGGGVTVTNDTLRICQYDSVALQITVDSADWKGIGLDWTLNMVDGTGTLASPQTGTGNTIIYDTTSSGLAPGRYVIDLVDIKIDTLGLSCTNTLDSNRIVLEIYSRPHAMFNTDTIEVCQDDSSQFDVIITEALFEGNPFDWSLHFTDSSGLIWTGSPLTGAGNSSPTFGVPATLPVGQYLITLDSIVKDADPHCMGILDYPDSLIINVRPKPMVTLTPQYDTVCQGIQTTYTIEVTNTHWFGGDSVNWRLDFNDGLFSTIGGSPLTGYGDTVATYITDSTLAVGNHQLVLTSITNTSDTCTRFLNDTLTLTVNFVPELTILDVMDPICDGDSLMVSFKIDSMNPGDSWMFSYQVDPNTNGNLNGTVSGSADGTGSYTGMFTVPDTIGYGPFSRLLNFGPVTNTTTGCMELDSVPDSTFYVHPLPAVDISNPPTVCSGHFDPITGDPVTGWEEHAEFDATISGTTVGSTDKSWTFYYHVEDTVSGYVSTTHTMSGSGDNGGAPYTLEVPDSLYYYFNATGDERGFKLVVDSIKITAGLALCQDLTQQDEQVFTVNTNPYFEWIVPDSICLGTPLEWEIVSSGLKGSDDWRNGFSWDTTLYDPTPYYGPKDFDETGSDTFDVTFPNTAYPIYATMWYMWSDTLVNKTTGCFYKPENIDSVRVDPPTVADSLFGSTTVCEDDNSGYLYMSGHVGHILYWEASYDEGFTWDTVSTAGNSPENKPVTFSSLLDTMWYADKTFKTRYRVWVKSGACDKDVSNVAHVYVNPRPMAAIVDLDDFICTGDSAKLRVNVTNVPTSNSWTVYYTTTSPAGSGTITGSGSGIATHYISGLTGTPSNVTIDSIYNNTTGCHNDELMNDITDSVYVYPFTDAGTLAAADTVCRDINSGTLTLSGYTGAVDKWQYMENGGSWTDIGNSADTYNYLNLDITTSYRVIVQNGSCDADTSNVVTITVMSLPHASITGSDTICPGTTIGLTVTVDSTYGGDWAIAYLEGSVADTLTGSGDGSFTLTTSAIYNTTDVTLQKIFVTSPVMNYAACENSQIDNPGTATVTIIDQATASINGGPDSICTGSDATIDLVVSNILNSDSVQIDWSINGSPQTALVFTGPGNHSFTIPSADISATGAPSTSYTITLDTVTNLSSTEPCAGLVDESHTIRVDTTTVAGTTSGAAHVCQGNNSGTITLSGNVGDVIYWESSEDGSSWTQVNEYSTVLTYNNLTDTTIFRAVVKNGACGVAYSTETTVTTFQLLATISGGDTICSGLTDDLTINIMNAGTATWYIALLEGTRTDTISGTGTTYTYTTSALSSTTDITLQSIWTGTMSSPDCANTLNNVATSTVTVLPRPYATITSGPSRLCEGSAFTFTVSVNNVATGDPWTLTYVQDGTSGTVSGTGSGSFTASSVKGVSPTSETISLSSITSTMGSNSCDSSLSSTWTIDVDPTTVAGVIGANDTVCMGGSGAATQVSAGTGGIIKWQGKVGAAGTWIDINNTTNSNPYYNVNDTSYFRAVYQSGVCPSENSNMIVVVPKPIPTASIRTTADDDSICAGNTADFEIVVTNVEPGQTFNVTYLEGQIVKSTPTLTQNATGVHTLTTGTLNSGTTIELRSITARVTDGGLFCGQNLSGAITIEVLPNPNASITSSDSRLCEGESATIVFNVSDVPTNDTWSLTYSQDGNDSTITGTGSGSVTVMTSRGVTATTETITLKSVTNTSNPEMCTTTLSESVSIDVDEPTVAGTIAADVTVCYGGSGSISEVTAGTGSIIGWQKRVKGTTAWVAVGNTTTTLNFATLTDTTEYRAVYKNGVCDVDHSNIITATPKPLPTATISTQAATDTICAGETATLSVTIDNVDAGDSAVIVYTEGSVSKTVGYRLTSMPETFDLNTGMLTTTTDVELQTITNVDPASGQPSCSNDLSNVAKATVTVIDLPNASIVSGPDTLCQEDEITFTVSVFNVKAGDNWRLLYTLEGDIDTLYGTGPTTLTHTDFDPNTAQSAIISLTEILNTSNLGRCKSDDTDDWNIYIYKPTVAGMIEAADTICKGGTTSLNEVSGTTKEGRIVEWEYRPASTGAWTTIANSSTTLDIRNLLETTSYRAIYKNGVCDTMRSNEITVEVRELPVATISGSTVICSGDTADLTVTVSNVGSAQDWEIDYLEGTTAKMLTGTGNGTFTLSVPGIITNTDVTLQEIRTVSGTPQCENDDLDNKGTATVQVNQRPYASLNSVNSPICETSDVTFEITVGNVRSGEGWTVTYDIDNTASGLTYSGSGPGTFTVNYGKIAAVNPVQDSYTVELTRIVNNTTSCDSSLSSSGALLIDAISSPGTMLNGATVCYGDNSGTVTYFGGNGDVVNWESSTDGGSSWSSIVNSDTFHNYMDLTDTTLFRVVMRNGECSEAAATPIAINVNPLPVAVISGSDTICAGETARLTVTASNTYGEDWSVSYLAGTVTDTLSVNGPLTSGVIVTNTLVTNTDVTLKKIWMTSGSPQCYNDDLNNNATATVEVNELPAVTINTLEDTVCTGNSASGKLVVDNVRSNDNWRVWWSINGGGLDSVDGTGAGSFNFSTQALTVDPSVVRLTDIRNLTTGCRYLPTDEDTVWVSPETNGGTLSGVDTVCYDDNSGTLTLGADAIGDVVRWEYSEDGGTTWTTIRHTGASYNYNDLTKTTIYRVLVQSGVCDAEYSTTVQVVVRPLPLAEIDGVGANSLCEGSSTYVVYTVSNVMASQSWTLKYLEGSTTKTVTGTGSGTDTIFTDNLTATTDITLQTIVITSGAPLCANLNLTNNQTTTITVIPDVDATIIDYPSDICVGTNPQITVLVSDINTSESWTLLYRVNNGSTQSTNGVGPGQYSFNIGALNTVGANGVRLVSITNTGSTPNCTAALTDSVTINVDATSLGGTIAGVDTVCYNEGSTLTVSGHRGTIQKWQYSVDGVNFYDIANTSTSHTFTNLTRRTWFRVEVKNGACDAVFSAAKLVDVQALPTVTITNPTQDICSGSSTTITVNVANVPSNATWTLSYTDNGTAMTYSGSGTSGTINLGPYTKTTQIVLTHIEVTNGLGCENSLSETATITVIPNPTATIDSAPDSLCEDDLISFKVAVDDVATGVAWELDYTIDGVAAATVTGTGSGVFSVNSLRAASPTTAVIALTSIEIVPAPGCQTTLSETHTIDVSPTTVPGTLSASSTTVCYGGSATLTLTGNTGDVKQWEYSTDGGSTWTVTSNMTTTLTVTNLIQTTSYRVYVQSGPCAGAYSNTVTVTVIPEPEATVTSNAKVCPGEAATFTLHVSNVGATDGWAVVYTRNGVSVSTPVTGTGPGDFDFTVPGSNYLGNPTFITVDLVSIENTTYGCINTDLSSTASARVTPNPVAAFTADNQCEDTVVNFVNNSTIPEGTITTYKWYFDDGDSSSTPDPTHAYANAGTYNVTLVAWSDNGCRGEVTQAVTIYDNPTADFTFDNVCQNETFSATDQSSVANGSIVSWFWTFGDGSTSTDQNPTHNYATSGTYDVTLTVTTDNGCTHTVSKEVIIYILPEANFVAEPVCEDDAMQFINTSAIGYGTMTYEWDFDGQGTSNQKDPSFTFTGFGDFNIELVATSNNGCRDTINRSVTVHPNPTASFSVDPVCIGETSEFVNSSSVPTGAIVEYFWNFDDDNFSGLKNPTHTYDEPGTYNVGLRVKTDKGCVDSTTTDAIVIALPDVELVPNDSQHIGGCDSIQLSARSDARTWDWERNGDTIATGVDNVFASVTGMYKVTISVSTLGTVCFNSDSVYVKVEPIPVVDAWPRDKITQNIDTISKGQSIDLNASATGYQLNESSFVWDPSGSDFLEGSNVGTKVITSQFLEADQVYTVEVTDGFGCTETAQVTVIVLDDFNLRPYNLITPNGDGMNDTWAIENIWAYPEAEVIIFNRYGMIVFEGNDYFNNPWDGTNQDNGKMLPDGPYYYVITHPDHPDTVYKGAINLIKN